MEEIVGLSKQDVQIIRALLRDYRNDPQPEIENQGDDFEIPLDTYVAAPPCGENIPACEGDIPGARVCCIFRIELDGPERNQLPATKVLKPVVNSAGSPVRRTVFNVHPEEWPVGTRYVPVKRDNFGRFLVEHPHDVTTTTTPDPSVETPTTAAPNGCTGTCAWTWDAVVREWTLDADGCNPTTTTTSTTDSPTTTTIAVTTTSCNCPPTTTTPGATSSTTTSSTTTSTTTTAPPCECLYPAFCGTLDGQTTNTYCSSIPNNPPADCPTSTSSTTTTTPAPTTTSEGQTTTTTVAPTTTTCDCATTTLEPGCSAGCDWKAVPIWGDEFAWLSTSDGCGSGCPCPEPSQAAADCQTAHTDCVQATTAAPIPPERCSGQCAYKSYEGNWFLVNSDCYGGGTGGCHCIEPSEDPPVGDCVSAIVPCVSPDPPPTTTVDPGSCAACYSTTATPTTAQPCEPCNPHCEICKYIYSDNCDSMILLESTCTAPCSCPEWLDKGHGDTIGASDGDVVEIPCKRIPTTTTTVAPTTTSCVECDPTCSDCMWKYSESCDEWVLITDGCGENCPCEEPPGTVPHHTHMEVITECVPTTTTTTTTVAPTTTTVCPTTTSTTTTAAPAGSTTTCGPTSSTTTTTQACGQCEWQWWDGVWLGPNSSCFDGCTECDEPGTGTTGGWNGDLIDTPCY